MPVILNKNTHVVTFKDIDLLLTKKNRPKRCNKKQREKLTHLIIKNDGIDELLKEVLRRDKFDAKFGIEDGVDNSKSTNEGLEDRIIQELR